MAVPCPLSLNERLLLSARPAPPLAADLPPPHYAFVKSRLLVQAAMEGGRLGRQRMYVLFAGQLDPPMSPHSPSAAGAPPEDRKISRFLLDQIFDCCAEQGWFAPVEQDPVAVPPPTLY